MAVLWTHDNKAHLRYNTSLQNISNYLLGYMPMLIGSSEERTNVVFDSIAVTSSGCVTYLFGYLSVYMYIQ